MQHKYAIGVDFGTLSGRAVLVRLSDGEVLGNAVYEYPHAVMDTVFAPHDGCRQTLPPDWALQHPRDYIEVLEVTIPKVLREAKVPPSSVVGLGIDFTASSPLPVTADGTPLCFLPEYAERPHAYVKLWKHHGAASQAARMEEVAIRRQENWLETYGGKVSSEWFLPKLYQFAAEAPDIYAATDTFVEAGDWIVWLLTGNRVTSTCMAGYKANRTEDGFPAADYLTEVDPVLAHAEEKWIRDVLPVGACAGHITKAWAQKLGLTENCSVAVAGIDGHTAVPAAGICKAGQMLLILGTSSCHMLVEDRFAHVSGICGRVYEGLIPGFYGYESGQSCVGDHYAWLCDHLMPASYAREAEERGISPQMLLTEKAARLRPGQSGLVALDWWNGNRSILTDPDLSGMIVGMTLATRVEDIYRALIEATAFGSRRIVENFRDNGLRVEEILVTGGIAGKNPMLMQIYADVLKMDLRIAGGTSALGAAIYGAVAAGEDGYPTMDAAAAAMGSVTDVVYHPHEAEAAVYDTLYEEYRRLHDYFGCGGNGVMHRLKREKASRSVKETISI